VPFFVPTIYISGRTINIIIIINIITI